MLEVMVEFVNKIVSFGKFKRSEISDKAYGQLLTSFQDMLKHDVVMIPAIINKVKREIGRLLLDTTDNPKYGLKEIAIKMKNLSNGGYSEGFKIVLFLYKVGKKTYPLGFALIHKESKTQEELVLNGLSRLRNEFKLKPKMVIADAGFSTLETLKRINNYRWGFVMKTKKSYKLGNKQIKRQIQGGYGTKIGTLSNGVKVKVVRRPNRVFITNRVSLSWQEILEYYGERWTIEETFRFLKTCIGLDRCQQHTIIAQGIYTFGCLAAYSIISSISDKLKTSLYKVANLLYSGDIIIDNSIISGVLVMN
jgi:hypothetical protein